MLPYADIIEKADRSWTGRLLARLEAADLSDDELDDLVGALQTVSDPRSFATLEAILVDPARPPRIREAAGAVLGGMQYLTIEVPEEKLRWWWREGDPVLCRHALSCMDAAACPDIILQVAADPSHEFHAAAIGMTAFNFDLPGHLRLKIAALTHRDPEVRASAAGILFWDEPVAAEQPLIEATRDPAPEVAAEVVKTLEYYPSLGNARCLNGLLHHPADRVRQETRASFGGVRHEFLLGLRSRDPRIARHVRYWLEPVWEILALTDDELHPVEGRYTTTSPSEPQEAMMPADLLGPLKDPDASLKALQELMWRTDWQRVAAAERGRLRGLLLGHPDPLVRQEAAAAFADWQDAGGLLDLVRDPDFGVRKSAMYRLGMLSPRSGIAEFAWDHLHRRDTLGVHATETLDTFVRHADTADAIQRLGWIAGDHGRRENLRVASVYHLAKLGAAEQVGQLAGQLLEPPAVTWALHIALLDAVVDLGLPTPDIGHLQQVDNLHVQAAVARVS